MERQKSRKKGGREGEKEGKEEREEGGQDPFLRVAYLGST